MDEKMQKIHKLANTLYSTTLLLECYCSNNDAEDIYRIKGATGLICDTADSLLFEIEKE